MITLSQEIMLGESDVVLTGGAENMSQAPYALRNVRWGMALGQDLKVRSTNWMRPTSGTCPTITIYHLKVCLSVCSWRTHCGLGWLMLTVRCQWLLLQRSWPSSTAYPERCATSLPTPARQDGHKVKLMRRSNLRN